MAEKDISFLNKYLISVLLCAIPVSVLGAFFLEYLVKTYLPNFQTITDSFIHEFSLIYSTASISVVLGITVLSRKLITYFHDNSSKIYTVYPFIVLVLSSVVFSLVVFLNANAQETDIPFVAAAFFAIAFIPAFLGNFLIIRFLGKKHVSSNQKAEKKVTNPEARARFVYSLLVIFWAIILAGFSNFWISIIPHFIDPQHPPIKMDGPVYDMFSLFISFEMLAVTSALFFIFGVFHFEILGQSKFRVYVTMPAIALITGLLGFIVNPFGLFGYFVLSIPFTFTGNALIVYIIRSYRHKL